MNDWDIKPVEDATEKIAQIVARKRNAAIGGGIGAAAGALIAGPLGAAIFGGVGGLIGAVIDQNNEQQSNDNDEI